MKFHVSLSCGTLDFDIAGSRFSLFVFKNTKACIYMEGEAEGKQSG